MASSTRRRTANVTLDSEGIYGERSQTLKRRRAGLLATFTRREHELRDLLSSDAAPDELEAKSEELKVCLSNLWEVHNLYTSLLCEGGDSSELARVEDSYTDVEVRFRDVVGLIEQFIEGACKAEVNGGNAPSDSIRPVDSVSQAGSGTSSARVRASAKKAALIARSQMLEQQHDLKLKQIQLSQAQESLELKTQILEVQAEETVYRQYEEGAEVHSVSSSARIPDTEEHKPLLPQTAEQGRSLGHVKAAEPPSWRQCETTLDRVNQPVPPTESESRLLLLQQQMINVMQLPKAELLTFDGDPLEYWMFIRSFENCIGNSKLSDSAKLNMLFQYCKADALKIIRCCAVMPPTEGYIKAQKLLRERFGDDYKVSEVWVTKVMEGPMVRPGDKVALQEIADDVRSCKETLQAMGRLDEIDTRRSMVKIVDRLPAFLQGRWRKEAVTYLNKKRMYPSIGKLEEFLAMAAQEANDPVFGYKDRSPNPTPVRRSDRFKGSGTSLGTQAVTTATPTSFPTESKPVLKCALCEGSHFLYGCEQFKKMSSEQKLSLVKVKGLCFNCFDRRHRAYRCQKPWVCGINGCQLKHSRLLHEALTTPTNADERNNTTSHMTDANETSGPIEEDEFVGVTKTTGVKTALPIVAVRVRGKGSLDYVKTYALLDPGSTRTFCSKALIDQLGLKGNKTVLSLTTASGKEDTDTLEVALELTGTKGKRNKCNVIRLPRVYTLPKLPSLKNNIASTADLKNWPHLRGIRIPQVDATGITLLIGQDNPEVLWPLQLIKGKEGEPYATKTPLGWTLNGPLGTAALEDCAVSNLIDTDMKLDKQVEQFWKMETSGILACGIPQLSADDHKVLNVWRQSVKLNDGHYQLDVPFKSNPPNLPDNRAVAEKRLQSLGRRLTRDPQLHVRYKAGIEDLVAKGYAEKVSEEEIDASSGKTWYIPHHSVTNVNKPEKLRIVFDCAAEYAGTSLNKEVFQGPDMTNKLIGVLVRFREGRFAVMSDIEAMFHQVKVSPGDRDALRFFWWKDGIVGQQLEVYRMTVHLFGGVWSPSCASFALKRVAEDHCDKFDPETIRTVHENFYADDCLKSVSIVAQAIRIVKQLCELLAMGGFRLTKWVSNSRDVLESVPYEERAKEVKDLDLDRSPLPIERALGTQWDTETDQFGFKIRMKQKEHTRRGLLSVVSSVYDPLGFVCPFILSAKLIFQDECKSKKGWDDPLDTGNQRRWSQWLEDLPTLENFKVERCVIPPDFGRVADCQLHHFADASQLAYGSVSYIRLVNEEGRIHCAFLLGKSRLAPIKQLTIPRLELCAAVVAVKADHMLRRELRLSIQDSVFWTDSMIVLQYINNQSKRLLTFVANRVAIIHDSSSPNQWKKVSSKDNPADDASRGLTAQEMVYGGRWVEGPPLLWKEESSWPPAPSEIPEIQNSDKEVKCQAKSCAAAEEAKESSIETLMCKYSSWYRLKKAVAWVLRYKEWLRDRKSAESSAHCHLTVEELRNAEVAIIRYVQSRHFPRELSTDGAIPRSSSIYGLEPFRDDEGILRVGGRLQASTMTRDAIHPVILPKDHHVAELIARQVHECESKHSGKEHVLSIIRRKYWIVKARPLINRVLKGCVVCKRMRGATVSQRMASLPKDRVTPGKPPFACVGVDCFGPFFVKRGRSQLKRYGCLFTCLAIRAIHIEKLDSLDADSFINALVRFTTRRGVPERIRSDNGTNFVGGERELREAIQSWKKDNKTKSHLLQNAIEWDFNPPAASHMGGVWERQIRTARKVLNAVLKDETLDDERLATLFCEVEAVVNGRPLTVVSDNPKDEGPLTPNHLLLLREGPGMPPEHFRKEDVYGRRWRHVQYLADPFWVRWVREYLPTLQLRSKWIPEKRNITEGDVVLVKNENTPRRCWPMGRVTRTFPGKDGLVRSAEVKTSWTVLHRPVDKLCLLEAVDG